MGRKRECFLSVTAVMLLPGVAAAQSAAAGPTDQSANPASPAASSASGQGAALEEILVTATKTGETAAQRTPLAVSVFSADQLNAAGVGNVKDLAALTPNLNVAQQNVNGEIYIRGIGSNNVFNGSDPDVTVQSDGVYIARAFAQFADFIDVDRVEVLRGPQGTLYGRNAVGGTINLISRTPSDQFESEAQLTGGDYGLFQAQSYVSGPLAPGLLQASLSGNYLRHNDYVENVVPGVPGINDANRGGVRGQLRFTPSEGIDMITRLDWQSADERSDSFDHNLAPVPLAPLANSILGDYTKVAINDPQESHTTVWGAAEEINLTLNDALSLKSLTAYRYAAYNISVDPDGTELVALQSLQADTSRQISQELDLNARFDRFEGVAGLMYYQEHETSDISSGVPPSVRTPAASAVLNTVTPYAQARSDAIFAQGTYHLTDELGVVAGIRYTHDRKELDQNFTQTSLNPATLNRVRFQFIGDSVRDYDSTTPKFGVNYQFTPALMAYVSATKGFKSGGTNFAATSPQAINFNPESIWAYEGGVKSDWLEHRLRVNVTAFKYNYKDLQVQSLIAPGVVAIGNAATADVKGLELETSAKPTSHVTLGLNFSLLDSRYARFDNASVPGALTPYVTGEPGYDAATKTFDASGNRLDSAPKESLSGNAQYDHGVGAGIAFVRAEYYWQARAYYDPSNVAILSQGPYGLINLSTGYNLPESGWGLQLMVKNVADKHYLTSIAAGGLVPAGYAGDPRTIALQIRKKW
jgi:iron complex outermembrane receptor protein